VGREDQEAQQEDQGLPAGVKNQTQIKKIKTKDKKELKGHFFT
jgi:hypothetical protein